MTRVIPITIPLALFYVSLCVVFANGEQNSSLEGKTKHLVSFLGVEPKVLEKKAQAKLAFKFKIQSGYHIQANPASQPQLIATTLILESTPGVQWNHPEYPKPKPHRLEGSDTTISTYDGEIIIHVPVSFKNVENQNTLTCSGSIRYQACDKTTCFFPRTLQFPVSLSFKN